MISRIDITGFQSHTKTSLEFSPGVNTIVGSTDSGKSAILRSLYWVLYNRPLGDDYVSKYEPKECKVSLTTKRGEAVRQKKPFNGYILNGKKLKEIGSSVPDELRSVIKVDEINFQPQFAEHYLVKLPPGQISKAVSTVLGFDVLDRATGTIRSECQSLSKQFQSKQQEREAVRESLTKFERLPFLQDQLAVIKAKVEVYEALRVKEGQLQALVAKLRSSSLAVDRTKKLMSKYGFLDTVQPLLDNVMHMSERVGMISTAVRKVVSASKAVAPAKAAVLAASKEVDALIDRYRSELAEAGTCPYCSSSITSETLAGIDI